MSELRELVFIAASSLASFDRASASSGEALLVGKVRSLRVSTELAMEAARV